MSCGSNTWTTTKAAFVGWIVRTKDRTFVRRMNDACRRGLYRPELFQEYDGRPLDDLWAEFISGFGARRRRL